MITVFALIEDDDEKGHVVAHSTDCPVVQEHRAQGRSIVTMIGVTKPLTAEVKQHDCMQERL
jgi:hypothetical protein